MIYKFRADGENLFFKSDGLSEDLIFGEGVIFKLVENKQYSVGN